MAAWILWFAAAGILVAAEIFTGTFYLLMLAFGFAAGGVSALAGAPALGQVIAAGVAGSAVTLGLYFFRHRRKPAHAAQADPAVLMDIGQTVQVAGWEIPREGVYRTRVSYRGAQWDAELLPAARPETGLFVINEIRGATLLIKNAQV